MTTSYLRHWCLVYALILAIFINTGLSQVGSDQIQKYFLNRGTLPIPRIVNKGRDISVRLGRPVTIPCEIMNKGESNVVWTHNDETNKESVIFAGDIKIRKDLRIKLIDGTSLYIKEATRAYAGKYRCEVEWSNDKKPLQIIHTLKVLVAPTVRFIPSKLGSSSSIGYIKTGSKDGKSRGKERNAIQKYKNRHVVDVREGHNVTLECKGDGIPEPAIHWKSTQWKNGDAREGSNLTLTEISRKDAGQYVCIASNKVGAPAKEEITLRAHFKPIVRPLSKSVKTIPDASIQMVCIVLSVPKPDVRWYFQHRVLSPDPNYKMEENGENNYTLTIHSIRERNLGNYTCQAVNKIGDGSSTIALKGIPFDLNIHSSSTGRYKTHYNLSWTLKSFAPIQKTELQFKRKAKNGKWRTKVIKHRRSYTMGGDFDGYDENDDYYYSDGTLNSNTNGYGHVNRIGSFKNGIAKGSYVFRNLSRNTEYEVKLRAKNRFGWSEMAPSIHIFRTSTSDPSPQKSTTYSRANAGVLTFYDYAEGRLRMNISIIGVMFVIWMIQ